MKNYICLMWHERVRTRSNDLRFPSLKDQYIIDITTIIMGQVTPY